MSLLESATCSDSGAEQEQQNNQTLQPVAADDIKSEATSDNEQPSNSAPIHQDDVAGDRNQAEKAVEADGPTGDLKEAATPDKESTRVRSRRRNRYQTQDLLREVSPHLETAPVPDNDVMVQKNQLAAAGDDQANLISKPDSNQTLPVTQKGRSKTVQCNICKRRMTESKLANHIRLLHVEKAKQATSNNSATGKKKGFFCEHCGKSYTIKYTYEQHVKTHIEGRPKCPECGSTFASAFSLFRHRAKCHNLEHNYTTYTCDQCDKTFFSSSELNLHRQRHSTQKDHKCPECKKAFAVKGNLRIHMRTHAKEKPYKCDICDNSFSHPYSLVSHRRIHTNDFPYECPECGKSYRSKHQLTSHSNVHSDNRPFKCDQCSKTFRSRTAYKMHLDHHKGIKRFTCKFCDRRFQCHANKLKHERRHIGEKRHKCEQCDKAFIEKQELKNHSKVHEKQVVESGNKRPEKTSENKKIIIDLPNAGLV